MIFNLYCWQQHWALSMTLQIPQKCTVPPLQVETFATSTRAPPGPALGSARAKFARPAVVGVGHIVAVASGKGGVGKSTTAGA